MIFYRSSSVYLATKAADAGATAGVRAREIVEVCKELPLLSVGATPSASSFFPIGKRFRHGLQQVQGPTILSGRAKLLKQVDC